jgi:hypothetical protein
LDLDLKKIWQVTYRGAVTVGVLVGMAAAIALSLHVVLGNVQDLKPEQAIAIILVAGVVILVSVLATTAVIFSHFGLQSPTEAFGLPEGSVRAMLALGLLLIFPIVAIFLYWQSSHPETEPLERVTAEQLNEIPGKELARVDRAQVPTAVPGAPVPTPGPEIFEVRRRKSTEASDDLALQIFATSSTLLVAVAGFYFGTKAVAVAKGLPEAGLGLRVLFPRSPYDLPSGTNDVIVRVESTTAGMSIDAAATTQAAGQDAGSVQEITHDTFRYQRPQSLAAPLEVDVVFSLSSQPDITARLRINVQP